MTICDYVTTMASLLLIVSVIVMGLIVKWQCKATKVLLKDKVMEIVNEAILVKYVDLGFHLQ